jgi:hypothetical protein
VATSWRWSWRVVLGARSALPRRRLQAVPRSAKRPGHLIQLNRRQLDEAVHGVYELQRPRSWQAGTARILLVLATSSVALLGVSFLPDCRWRDHRDWLRIHGRELLDFTPNDAQVRVNDSCAPSRGA